MRIVIVGLGKSGTTALLHKVAGAFPGATVLTNRPPPPIAHGDAPVICKYTFNPAKSRSSEFFEKHLEQYSFDRRIWIVRDPRDRLVSDVLFRWHRGYPGDDASYANQLALVKKKERDPLSVPFHEVCRAAPWGTDSHAEKQLLAEERAICEAAMGFVAKKAESWLVFAFRDMVANRFGALDRYLGAHVSADAEITNPSERKVIRGKRTGDWRSWFTPEDVVLFRPVYEPFLSFFGFDALDWELDPSPKIDPKTSSEYIAGLRERYLARQQKQARDATGPAKPKP